MDDTGLLKAIYGNVVDGILVIDTNGCIIAANPAACSLFGYTLEEFTGKPTGDLFGQYELPGFEAGHLGYCVEIKARRKSDDRFPCRLSASGIRYDGRLLCAAMIHDLSLEKRTEQRWQQYTSGLETQVEERTKFLQHIVQTLEQAKEEVNVSLLKEKEVNQLKTRFISLASHEFRTPLSSIQLSAALIERYYDRLDRFRVFAHLQKIRMAVGDLTGILEDFLCLENIDRGNITVHYTDFNLPEFCSELVSEMQAQSKPGQKISCTHHGEIFTVSLDKKLLRHALVNLLSNAIKYSGPDGLIDIATKLEPSVCEISIADNGIGIPPADKVHLFDAFFRAHNTINIPGTGLGLNIVKRYTDLMRGDLRFESEEHVGTTFTLCFPAP